MEANPVRIVQYFDGEKQSIIPLFQRPCTWNKGNWETLWENKCHSMTMMIITLLILWGYSAKTVPVDISKSKYAIQMSPRYVI